MKKKLITLMLSCGATLVGLTPAFGATPGQEFRGSCQFQGQFASGCIEFLDGTWTPESMFQYCQSKSRDNAAVAVDAQRCPRNEYNSLCSSSVDGQWANMYVNNMPAYICKKYNAGELTKRPTAGWDS